MSTKPFRKQKSTVKKQAPNLGFTLIEFLLAMAIFSTIALSLYSTFYSGMQINKKTKNLEQFLNRLHTSIETIQLDLENMTPFQHKVGNTPLFAFSGDEKSFSLIVTAEEGLKSIRYYLVEPQEAHIHEIKIGVHTSKNVTIKSGITASVNRANYLIREERSLIQTDEQSSIQEILNKNTLKNSLKISYASYEKDSLIWKDKWEESYFPAGIRLQISFIDPDNPNYLEAINRIMFIPLGLWRKINQ